MKQRRFVAVTGAIIIAVFALSGPKLLSQLLSNLGMITVAEISLKQSANSTTTTSNTNGENFSNSSASQLLEPQIALFRLANKLSEDSLSIKRRIAHSMLVAGYGPAAVKILSPLTDQFKTDPILYYLAILAYFREGHYERVVESYEIVSPQRQSRLLNDMVALAYLKTSGLVNLQTVHDLRQHDLFVNFSLWQKVQETDDLSGRIAHEEALRHFSLDSISPGEEGLLYFATITIPELLNENIWDRNTTLNVVAYLVWKHHGVSAVEQMLEQLGSEYPDEPEWTFYLAEIYQRRGIRDRSESLYESIVERFPDFAPSYLRLGMLAEQGAVSLDRQSIDKAANWYSEYQKLFPADLLGHKLLADICERAQILKIESDSCGADLMSPKENQAVVADMLNLQPEVVLLGPNLIENGGFEYWQGDLAESWKWFERFNVAPFNSAAYAGHADDMITFEGQTAAIIDGFWIQKEKDKSLARMGTVQWDDIDDDYRLIEMEPDTPYLLSFRYRTERVTCGAVTVYVSGVDDESGFWSGGNFGLRTTDGAWYRFTTIIKDTRNVVSPFQILLQSYAEGIVSFDDVQLRPIKITDKAIAIPTSGSSNMVRIDSGLD